MQVLGGNTQSPSSAKVFTAYAVYSTTGLGIFDYIAMLSDCYGLGYLEQRNEW